MRNRRLVFTVAVLAGFILGVADVPGIGDEASSNVALAQSTVDDTLQSPCRLTQCMFTITCENDNTWGDEDAFWQEVTIIPQKSSGARPRELVWQDASGEFQPFQFTVTWKNLSSGFGTQTETVTINDAGNDTGATSHPNIRFHKSTVTLCDGFTPIDPFQRTGTHNSNTCIEAVIYNFDVRRFHDGDETDCYVGSQGRANSENADLDAVQQSDCGDSVTPWTFQTQKLQNLNCLRNIYFVRYNSP